MFTVSQTTWYRWNQLGARRGDMRRERKKCVITVSQKTRYRWNEETRGDMRKEREGER